MLCAIDAGNTHVVIGLFRDEELVAEWRIGTNPARTADEYGILCEDLFRSRGLTRSQVTGLVLSCVVPPLTPVLQEVSRRYFSCEALLITAELETGLTIRYDNPRDVGADRIANAVAAHHEFGGPIIIVDFGTATTLDAVSRQAEYLGGAICPGLLVSAEALFHRTAMLPKVELVRPASVIGRDTVRSIQSGLLYGHAGLVDAIVHRMQHELEGEASVVATGGLASLVASECMTIKVVRPHLTLHGLRLIYTRHG